MEKPSIEESNKNNDPLERKLKYYLKDFPLSDEDLQKSILDVGTGTGEFVQYLRDVLGNKHAFGVDYQQRKVLGKEGLIAADGFKLPFDDETFEIVTAHNYLPMFVEDPIIMQAAIIELIRVTKSGGRVMGDIETPEGASESDEALKRNLGEKYIDRDKARFSTRYKGAEDLQSFLTHLGETHQVTFTSPSNDVVVITK